MEDYDSSYVPTESKEVASFTSASDYGETFNNVRTPPPRGLASYWWFTMQRDLGEYITVLNKHEVDRQASRMTELLLNLWAKESVAVEIQDLLHVSRNGPVR
jgi:hypothetical protein